MDHATHYDECLAALAVPAFRARRFRDPAEALDDPDLADRGTFAPIADVAANSGVQCAVADVGCAYRDRAGDSVNRIPRDDVLARVLGLSADEIAKAAVSGAFGKAAMRQRNDAAAGDKSCI